jgi:hypothetical protein
MMGYRLGNLSSRALESESVLQSESVSVSVSNSDSVSESSQKTVVFFEVLEAEELDEKNDVFFKKLLEM